MKTVMSNKHFLAPLEVTPSLDQPPRQIKLMEKVESGKMKKSVQVINDDLSKVLQKQQWPEPFSEPQKVEEEKQTTEDEFNFGLMDDISSVGEHEGLAQNPMEEPDRHQDQFRDLEEFQSQNSRQVMARDGSHLQALSSASSIEKERYGSSQQQLNRNQRQATIYSRQSSFLSGFPINTPNLLKLPTKNGSQISSRLSNQRPPEYRQQPTVNLSQVSVIKREAANSEASSSMGCIEKFDENIIPIQKEIYLENNKSPLVKKATQIDRSKIIHEISCEISEDALTSQRARVQADKTNNESVSFSLTFLTKETTKLLVKKISKLKKDMPIKECKNTMEFLVIAMCKAFKFKEVQQAVNFAAFDSVLGVASSDYALSLEKFENFSNINTFLSILQTNLEKLMLILDNEYEGVNHSAKQYSSLPIIMSFLMLGLELSVDERVVWQTCNLISAIFLLINGQKYHRGFKRQMVHWSLQNNERKENNFIQSCLKARENHQGLNNVISGLFYNVTNIGKTQRQESSEQSNLIKLIVYVLPKFFSGDQQFSYFELVDDIVQSHHFNFDKERNDKHILLFILVDMCLGKLTPDLLDVRLYQACLSLISHIWASNHAFFEQTIATFKMDFQGLKQKPYKLGFDYSILPEDNSVGQLVFQSIRQGLQSSNLMIQLSTINHCTELISVFLKVDQSVLTVFLDLILAQVRNSMGSLPVSEVHESVCYNFSQCIKKMPVDYSLTPIVDSICLSLQEAQLLSSPDFQLLQTLVQHPYLSNYDCIKLHNQLSNILLIDRSFHPFSLPMISQLNVLLFHSHESHLRSILNSFFQNSCHQLINLGSEDINSLYIFKCLIKLIENCSNHSVLAKAKKVLQTFKDAQSHNLISKVLEKLEAKLLDSNGRNENNFIQMKTMVIKEKQQERSAPKRRTMDLNGQTMKQPAKFKLNEEIMLLKEKLAHTRANLYRREDTNFEVQSLNNKSKKQFYKSMRTSFEFTGNQIRNSFQSNMFQSVMANDTNDNKIENASSLFTEIYTSEEEPQHYMNDKEMNTEEWKKQILNSGPLIKNKITSIVPKNFPVKLQQNAQKFNELKKQISKVSKNSVISQKMFIKSRQNQFSNLRKVEVNRSNQSLQKLLTSQGKSIIQSKQNSGSKQSKNSDMLSKERRLDNHQIFMHGSISTPSLPQQIHSASKLSPALTKEESYKEKRQQIIIPMYTHLVQVPLKGKERVAKPEPTVKLPRVAKPLNIRPLPKPTPVKVKSRVVPNRPITQKTPVRDRAQLDKIANPTFHSPRSSEKQAHNSVPTPAQNKKALGHGRVTLPQKKIASRPPINLHN